MSGQLLGGQRFRGRNDWFAPASQILDFLRTQPAWTGELPFRQRLRLDVKFIVQHFGR